ncbi:DUF11 domain-containing protein [Alteraurantiacibacter aquimixticola]|uniref:DUF11 domain-containing protein n=1 Tax=Alteraurantiacibacter aquimixticola TaxID=2489173 RepID=UPI001B7D879C|nr:DUF11 domain-containing protein [Alteraurantiacibacter aquimixticola]
MRNIAEAHWMAGDTPVRAISNEVSIPIVSKPVAITTYHLDGNSKLSLTMPAARCGSGNGATLTPASAGSSSDHASQIRKISPTSKIRIGEDLIVGVEAAFANRDPDAVDLLTFVITTESGDREEIVVGETGPDTGIFMGSIPTGPIPMPAVHDDCTLSLVPLEHITVEVRDQRNNSPLGSVVVSALVDPYGYVFDSETGEAVDGAVVTLINVDTGLPATVFAHDGVTPWPSTVVTGSVVTDGAGNIYTLAPGEYLFPLVPEANYRIEVSPPDPYSAPSIVSPGELAELTRPNGTPLVIRDGSYGGSFLVTAPDAMRIDIPLDRPTLAVGLSKVASREVAEPGDPVIYTVTVRNLDPSRAKRNVTLVDRPSRWLRLRSDSIRIDGEPVEGDALTIAQDGGMLTLAFDKIDAGATATVTYAMIVLPDAPPGDAVNVAEATDIFGNASRAQANLRIARESIAGRMTLIGRISAGDCAVEGPRPGIPGVRVMLEDGSFAITDADGRYHFEGLIPGTHVVQIAERTLPEGGELVDCARSTRSAGKDNSRFITGQGGSLAVADFHAIIPQAAAVEEAASAAAEESTLLSDTAAAGSETDWIALGDGANEFLFPAIDHNPRAPAVRVAIRHRGDQTIALTANGAPVDPLTFEGTDYATGRAFGVSAWRGIHIEGEVLQLRAEIRNADGSVAETLTRDVFFANRPARVELLEARSQLVADGTTRPVVAVRITDSNGRPVHAGITGEFGLSQPYESAQALDAMQSRMLSGLNRNRPVWRVEGDDGIALIELAPTMVSGKLTLDFAFVDKDFSRQQQLDAWIVPGDMEWTIVGLVEGSVGSQNIADNMQRTGTFDSDLGDNARVALYAKGRVLGRFLLTAAYDSAKQSDDQPLLGQIDPQAYYTVFADGSTRRFDAASREKLYVRIETAAFYALYGDFVTGFDQTQLARYNRTMTGVKAELQTGGLHVEAFAAETGSTYRRDEIQGEGLSGPYQLSSRAIIANSERVVIEVRDRLRSELIVSTRQLTRFVDYDIDLLSGTIRFSEPVLSRDPAGNPQFIVIDYEVDELGEGELNAGLRADYTTADGNLRVGTTVISEKGREERANLAAVDVQARIGENTEIRAEAAISRSGDESGEAWLVEVEHHDGNLDLLAYARSVSGNFGVGQQNLAERGRRKVGVDARYALSENMSVTASGWLDNALDGANARRALQLRGEYRTGDTDLLLGLTHFADTLSDGSDASSTVLEGGATQRLFGNKLELSALSSIALGETGSVDLPVRHRIGARYAITSDVRAIGSYEIANGDAVDARTARVGLELTPWDGARMIGSLGQEEITEYGKRAFAAFGLAQSLQLNEHLTVDATVDHNRTIGGSIAEGNLVNPAHPAASGGQLGQNGTLAEDFTAITLGATYRRDRWAVTGRGEWRGGEFANRRGLTFGAIRQIGEGSMLGSGFTWTSAKGIDGATSEVFDGSLVAASRPDSSSIAWLAKAQFRSDKVSGAVAGNTGTVGNTIFNVDGDAISRRLIGSASVNWSPRDQQFLRRSEFGLFLGSRYSFDEIAGYDISAWTLLAGLDARIGLGERFEIGAIATARASVSDGYVRYAIGPNIGFTPTDDVLITLGYNITGFRDPDFSSLRHTNEGLYVSGKIKFDAGSFGFLGLGQ